MEKKTIKLNIFETAAYWWIGVLRKKINEIYRYPGRFGEDEKKLASLFVNYSEHDWQSLYKGELLPCITYSAGKGNLKQFTARKGHKVINWALWRQYTNITKMGIKDLSEFPDISFSLFGKEDIDIEVCTSSNQVKVDDKVFSFGDIDANYNYVLGNDEKELDFYNLILGIIIQIRQKDNQFDSLSVLKNHFCKIYASDNGIKNIDELEERFDRVIEVLSQYSIIKVGLHHDEMIIDEWPTPEMGNSDLGECVTLIGDYPDRILGMGREI